MRAFRTTWVGLEYLFKTQKRRRETEGHAKRECRDCSDVATNQEVPGITRARRDSKDSPRSPLRKCGPADTSVLYSAYLTIPTSKRHPAHCFLIENSVSQKQYEMGSKGKELTRVHFKSTLHPPY